MVEKFSVYLNRHVFVMVVSSLIHKNGFVSFLPQLLNVYGQLSTSKQLRPALNMTPDQGPVILDTAIKSMEFIQFKTIMR